MLTSESVCTFAEVMVLFLGESYEEDKDDAARGGEALFVLFLTLSEAETLRCAMQENSKAFIETAATLLLVKHIHPTVQQSGSDSFSWDRLRYNWNSLLLSEDLIMMLISSPLQEMSEESSTLNINKAHGMTHHMA